MASEMKSMNKEEQFFIENFPFIEIFLPLLRRIQIFIHLQLLKEAEANGSSFLLELASTTSGFFIEGENLEFIFTIILRVSK